MTDNEFEVVKRKNKRKKPKQKPDRSSGALTNDVMTYLDIQPRLQVIRDDSSVIQLAQSIIDELLSWRPNDFQELRVICYGLGQFTSCITARYQLVILCLILERMKISKSNCRCFDPLFTSNELGILKEMEFSIETKNEEGKCKVSRPTVFYMPHCGKALYNNLLWANWYPEQLHQMSIIGNSFTEMKSSMLNKVMETEYKYINNILHNLLHEKPLDVPLDIENMFCNTSMHTFSQLGDALEDEKFWDNSAIPVYDSDVEIIQNSAAS